mmetsp:Transcript_114511/g.323783  ORF Transcript_114511/g.323783 Transcript_114511/m.323783 type:complete len:207 (-) Transcript_114511:382-1002(-)
MIKATQTAIDPCIAASCTCAVRVHGRDRPSKCTNGNACRATRPCSPSPSEHICTLPRNCAGGQWSRSTELIPPQQFRTVAFGRSLRRGPGPLFLPRPLRLPEELHLLPNFCVSCFCLSCSSFSAYDAALQLRGIDRKVWNRRARLPHPKSRHRRCRCNRESNLLANSTSSFPPHCRRQIPSQNHHHVGHRRMPLATTPSNMARRQG